MEIKYTLEILTKDIQDIEKLVANLQNSPDGSTLELDLALSKLRNVYDMLSVIRSDRDLARKTTSKISGQSPPSEAKPVAAKEEPVVKEEPVAKEEPVVKEEPVAKEEVPDVAKPKSAPKKSAEIVAEKFEAESSINENLAGNREADMDSKLIGQPIESISRNIGINDRFLIIRELFDGDADSFGKLIEDLDGAGSMETATRLIETVFDQTSDHEGVSILTGLVRRRYNKA